MAESGYPENSEAGKLPVMVVTGASDGVGAAIAKYFSSSFQVCALARREEKLKEVASAAKNPNNVTVFSVDVSDKEAVSTASKCILEKFGKVDILVNNAAIMTQKKLIELTLDECDTMIDVNLKGTIYVTKSFLPSMISNSGGKIIMINSVAGLPSWTPPTETVYCASKHGQTGFTNALANEVRENGITVTSIHPGGIDTPLQAQCPRDVAEKFLTVDDIVESVEYVVNANPKTLVKSLNLFRSAFWH
jgi:3-oxoacyl-[acyl-carrier protein] reductase